jgi:hypothetical protein
MNSYFDSGVNILVSSLIEFTYWMSQIYLLFKVCILEIVLNLPALLLCVWII